MASRSPTGASEVEAYLAGLGAEQRNALEALRAAIRAAAPDAEECMSYGVPAFRRKRPLVGYGASANHCALYLMSGSTVAAHEEELRGYDTSKGTIRFSPGRPIPTPLVARLVRARIAEIG